MYSLDQHALENYAGTTHYNNVNHDINWIVKPYSTSNNQKPNSSAQTKRLSAAPHNEKPSLSLHHGKQIHPHPNARSLSSCHLWSLQQYISFLSFSSSLPNAIKLVTYRSNNNKLPPSPILLTHVPAQGYQAPMTYENNSGKLLMLLILVDEKIDNWARLPLLYPYQPTSTWVHEGNQLFMVGLESHNHIYGILARVTKWVYVTQSWHSSSSDPLRISVQDCRPPITYEQDLKFWVIPKFRFIIRTRHA